MKRKLKHEDISYYPPIKKQKKYDTEINDSFITKCKREYNDDPSNVAIGNAVAIVGSLFPSTNKKRVNEITHIFMNSVKPKDLRATDQGNSGRCWMFSGLNVLRNIVIKSLDVTNFEFSETYLFFWDKWERCNVFLTEIIDHPDIDLDNRYMEYVLSPGSLLCDGGWWNMFANLVKKYGLMPKSAYGESESSGNTGEMNDTLRDYVVSTGQYIYNNPQLSIERKNEIRVEALSHIHSILCKYLGEPPSRDDKIFSWEYKTDNDDNKIIQHLSPIMFRDMIMPTFKIEDFVVLSNIPTEPYYQKYEVACTNNIIGGKHYSFVNVPIKTLKDYTMKVISKGLPVWFAGDVGRNFHYWFSALDEELFNSEAVFGKQIEFNKSNRIRFRNTAASHAMTFTGFNANDDGPINWQVENSWGYWDPEIPGLDGWLAMSDSWFTENVFQIVIHKNFLSDNSTASRHLRRAFESEAIMSPPWNNFAPALKIGTFAKPENYKDKSKSFERMKRMQR